MKKKIDKRQTSVPKKPETRFMDSMPARLEVPQPKPEPSKKPGKSKKSKNR
jgi:hypothetical protein